MNNNINVKLNPPQGIRVEDTTVYVYDNSSIGDGILTIQKNGSNVATFTANSSSNATANITVPTKTSDLTNDDGFITGISSSDITTALGYTPADSSSLATVATSGLYSDLTGTPTIPTVNNPTITITQGGVNKGSFTLNQSSGDTIALDAGGGGSLPSQTGNAGKFLTTDGTDPSWASITIPTVNNPKITITQGGVEKGSFTLNQSTVDTIALDAGGSLPSQSGNNGKFLTTDGTDPSWASITIPTVNDATLTIQKNGTNVGTFTANQSTDETINITAMETDLSNITTIGKATGASLAMPSSTYDDLTLGASGSTYTAPANGYFYFSKFSSASNQYITMYIDNGGTPIFATTMTQSISGGQARCFLPVKKGDVVGVSYDLGGTTRRFCFVYAEGEV